MRLRGCESCDRCDKQAELYSNKQPPAPAHTPPSQYSDQRLTRGPAHSQLLIVTRRIWRIIIQNNLLPWRRLTPAATDAPSPCPAPALGGGLASLLLKCWGLEMYIITLISSSTSSVGPRRERPQSHSAELHTAASRHTFYSQPPPRPLMYFMKASHKHKISPLRCPIPVIHSNPRLHQLPSGVRTRRAAIELSLIPNHPFPLKVFELENFPGEACLQISPLGRACA